MKNGKMRRSALFEFTTHRPVAILMVTIAVVVFGYISFKQLSLNLMPDISYPRLTVRTEYPGSAPEEVETSISRPLEQSLGVVSKLVNISSISRAGLSDIILEFAWGTDMNSAAQEVREKIDHTFLPLEAKRPILLRYDPSLDPILRISLSGKMDLRIVRRVAEEEVKRELESLPGVAAVKVRGGLEEEINVLIDEKRLSVLGINIQTIANRLRQENINLAGGNLKEGQAEYLVRTLNEFKSVEELNEIVVGNDRDVPIRLKDVAQVKRSFKEREIITRVNGIESVEIDIYKEADANIVSVAKIIRQRLFGKGGVPAEQVRSDRHFGEGPQPISVTLGDEFNLDILSDQSIFIKESIDDVLNTAVMGGIIAVLVLFLFLRRISNTVIVALSIPISIVATFAPMKMMGVSLNIMSLGGLALGIGMLVDNSIVVLESIFRCRKEGDGFVEGVIRGASEVGSAVIASTLTTVAVFFPIFFVEGVAGQIFGDLAITVVFSLLTSLLIALFLIPMLSSRRFTESGLVKSSKEKIREADLFRFTAMEKLKSVNVQKGSYRKIISVFRYGIFIFPEAIFKIILSVFAMSFLLIKAVLLLFLFILSPFAGIVGLIMKRPEAGRGIVFRADGLKVKLLRGFSDLWKGIFSFKSFGEYFTSVSVFHHRWREKGIKGKIMLFFSLPFRIAYWFTRLLLTFVLEFIGRAIFLTLIFFTFIILMITLMFIVVLFPVVLPILKSFNVVYTKIERGYPVFLQYSLKHRHGILGFAAILFFLTIFGIYPNLGKELIPQVHQGEFNVDVILPVGSPLEETDEMVSKVESIIMDIPTVKKTATVSGVEKEELNDAEKGENTGTITVRVEAASSMAETEGKTIDQIRSGISDIPGLKFRFSRSDLFTFRTPLEVQIKGYDLKKLKYYGKLVEARLSQIPGLYDVKSNIQAGNPEIRITYDRERIAHLGLNVYDVASLVRSKVLGDVPTKYKEQERRIDIRVWAREEDRTSVANLRELIINPGGKKLIPLKAVAEVKLDEGPSEIRRIGQQRVAVVSANLSGVDLWTAAERIKETLQSISFPDDFQYEIGGQKAEMDKSLKSLFMALALSIFLVYVVMASQFESLLHPFIVMFTIPLAFIGVFVTLFLFNVSISVVVFLGMIMLTGIVVNNAIVLIDYMNQLRRRGMSLKEAVIEGGRIRLRPILMTAGTTILGLLPMALGFGEGAEIRSPMALTVIAGLISATALTLVIIPLVYYVVNSLLDYRESMINGT